VKPQLAEENQPDAFSNQYAATIVFVDSDVPKRIAGQTWKAAVGVEGVRTPASPDTDWRGLK
jgi:hypothetical protein